MTVEKQKFLDSIVERRYKLNGGEDDGTLTPQAHAVLQRIACIKRWRLHNVPSDYKHIVDELILADWVYLGDSGYLYLTLNGYEQLFDANSKKIQQLGDAP